MQSEGNNDVTASDLADLRYFSTLAKNESDRIAARLRPFLDESVPAGSALAIQQVASCVGELAARVQILESALELKLADPDPFSGGPLLRGAGHIGVEDLARQRDCHAAEGDETGRKMIWTRSAEMHLHIYATRFTQKFARLFFQAVIKPEYARKLQVTVDGRKQKHAVLRQDGQYAIEWRLPETADLDRTEISIVLPGIHSPAELGVGEDYRRLGIAITGLEFDGSRRQSLVARLLRR